jgi:hypothetical protein
MTTDQIEALGIDDKGSLWVKPATGVFPHIYRTGTGVGWDPGRRCLFTPQPRELSYSQWFQQIISAARGEYAVDLRLAPTTRRSNISVDLEQEIRGLT